ncbi:zinc ribbon domain-containing protein [Candidatus Bathyarchaeota archaeon]|nr:zinc ribbon domain-containing protein [Candidatus Bathyarchaeota archaeon]
MKTSWPDDIPLLWVVPASALLLFTLIGVLNLFLNIIPSRIAILMMLISSSLLGTAISAYITELSRGRAKFVQRTMWATLVVGALVFYLAEGFLKGTSATGVETAQMPLIGNALSSLTLTIVPALVTGSICGGVACLIPEIVEAPTQPPQQTLPRFTPDDWPGYEKQCQKCGNTMPFDSIYCSNCGSTLRRVRASQIKYCRYCGNRMHFIGEFCPDCGREINILSKPKVYVSQ